MICIIQARTGSTRFRNKILNKINSLTLLEILIKRLKRSKKIRKIVVATTTLKADNIISSICKKNKVDFFKGSEKNVLSRYYNCWKIFGKKNEDIIRITSDCPLSDPKIIDSIANLHIKKKSDYTSNTILPSFPDGMDVEIFKSNLLKEINISNLSLEEKEHVTLYIKNNKRFKKINFLSKIDNSHLRLTVDYKEDFELIKNIIHFSKKNIYIEYKDILKLSKKKPQIFKMNNFLTRDEALIKGKGQKLWIEAKKVIPGGSMLFSKRQETFLPDLWPTYFSKSKGCYLWDLDDKKYLDFSLMGVGTNILGYANSKIDSKVKSVVKKGNLTTLNCPEEVELSKKLIKMHPWSSMSKFTRSGGEANAVSIRIARTFSKKNKILACGYHGWHDWYLSSKKKNLNFNNHLPSFIKDGGIPDELKNSVFIFRYNDFEGFKRLYFKNKKEIGIVKMEVSRNELPKDNFLKKIRKFCDKHSLVLIFDECTSGFRETYGGLHLKYNVNPDIAIFGKALGNGYAVNAIIGKRNIMASADDTFISSTFWTERIGSTAALATLKEMKRIHSWKIICKKGIMIKKNWKKIFKKYNFRVQIYGLDSMPTFKFIDIDRDNLYRTFITKEMLQKNILATNSVYLSISHSDILIKKYLDNFEKIIAKLSFFAKNNEQDLVRKMAIPQVNR